MRRLLTATSSQLPCQTILTSHLGRRFARFLTTCKSQIVLGLTHSYDYEDENDDDNEDDNDDDNLTR